MEDRARLEVERQRREEEQQQEAACRDERQRKEDKAYEEFEADKITFEEYSEVLKTIEEEFEAAAWSEAPTDPSKDTSSEVSSTLETRSASKRKASSGKGNDGPKGSRVRNTFYFVSFFFIHGFV
jgi:hypothetical protein